MMVVQIHVDKKWPSVKKSVLGFVVMGKLLQKIVLGLVVTVTTYPICEGDDG